MHFSTFLLALLPLSIAAPFDIESRSTDNTAAILKSLTTTGTDTKNLNTTLNGIADSGPISSSQLSALLKENNAITSALNAAIKSANSSSAFTSTDSQKLNSAVTTLETPTFQVLNNLVAHKVAFQNSGTINLVTQNLQGQEELVRELGDTLATKVTAPYQSQAPAIAAAYKTHFQSAISSLNS